MAMNGDDEEDGKTIINFLSITFSYVFPSWSIFAILKKVFACSCLKRRYLVYYI